VTHDIHVPWKVIDFAVAAGDNSFRHAIEELLKAGYHVEVGLDGGSLTFTRVDAFRIWFEELKTEASDQL